MNDIYTQATTEQLVEWLRDIRAERRRAGATATIDILIVPPEFMVRLGIAQVERIQADAIAIENELVRRQKAGA